MFQGTADGRFIAYNATKGEKLWESPTGTGVVAAASTYMVDGKQYVSVAVGWGGVYGVTARATEHNSAGDRLYLRRGWQGVTARLHQVSDGKPAVGREVRSGRCRSGHPALRFELRDLSRVPGVDKGGNVRNLAYVGADPIRNLKSIMFSDAYTARGMPNFTGKLSDDDVVKLTAFIQGVANSVRPKEPAK